MLDRGSVEGLTNGIEQVEDASRALTVAQVGERPPDPDRCVGVLSAILPDARRIRLDVPRVPAIGREGRRQQSHEAFVDIDEFTLDCAQRPLRPRRRAASRNDGPRLRDRIDPAFRVLSRTPRPPLVVERTPVPLAVPPVLLRGVRQLACAPSPTISLFLCRSLLTDVGEAIHRSDREPREPDALPPAQTSDPVHAIVPVARTDEGQAVRAVRDPALERSLTVLEESP